MTILLDRLAAGFRPYLLLVVLTLAVALPGIASVPALDRDEARFAVASREMLETGDFVTVRFQNELRAKKPPGIYWLQAESAALFDAPDAIWAYRLPSVLGALIAVLVTFALGARLFGRPAALAGATLLAITPLFVSEAHQAKTDAVLLACAVVTQAALARFYLAARRNEPAPGLGTAIVFWLAQAAAILVKGPIVPMISALTAIVLAIADRRNAERRPWLGGLRPVLGIALVIVLVAPWAILVSRATQGQFIVEAANRDLFAKLTGGQESHAAPPLSYLALATGTLWPASTFALIGFVAAIRRRADPAMRFCLAWLVPSWIVFELVPTKLPHYVLPLVPALMLMAGAAVARNDVTADRPWVRWYAYLCALVGIAFAAGLLVARIMMSAEPLDGGALLAALALLAAAIAPTWMVARKRLAAALGAATVGAVLSWAMLFAFVGPSLDRLWLADRIARLVPPGAPAIAAGFREPSLVFALGTATKFGDGAAAAAFLMTAPHGVAVVEKAASDVFNRRLTEAGRTAKSLGEVDGLNYSRGRSMTLTVWTLATP